MTYVPQKNDCPVVRFIECSLFFFQVIQASFSCPPAPINSHNLQDKSTSRLMKEIQASQKSAYKTGGTEQL